MNAINEDILDLMTAGDSTDETAYDAAPQPAQPWFATYGRFRDGEWGARIESAARPLVGDRVECQRRNNGGSTIHRITLVNRTGRPGAGGLTVYMCRIAADVAPAQRQAIPTVRTPASAAEVAPTVKPSRLVPVPVSSGPELFGVRAAASRGDLVAGAAAEGHGILTAFDGRGPMTQDSMKEYLATAGCPAEWCRPELTAHAQAGRVLDSLNRLGYVCRSDRSRRTAKHAANAADVETDLMVAADAREDQNNYASDAIMRQVRTKAEIPNYAGRWVVSAGRGRAAELGASAGTVIMVATLDQNGNLHIECDNEALYRRVREDFDARIIAKEFQANDVTSWVHGLFVEKFGAARLGGCWYIRHEHAAAAERLLTVLSLHWGCNWMLPALPIATTEQLCTGLANGLLVEAQAVADEFAKLGAKATSKVAEGRYADVKSLVSRAFGLATVIGDERVSHLVEQLGTVADTIAKSINKPMPPFASVARSMAPRR